MVILGLGLGMVMQVLVLAVQNAVDYRLLGVATSGSTLFRQIGGSIGVAAFGAIFANRLATELAANLPAGADIPAGVNPALVTPPASRRARALRAGVRHCTAARLPRRRLYLRGRVRAHVAPPRDPAPHQERNRLTHEATVEGRYVALARPAEGFDAESVISPDGRRKHAAVPRSVKPRPWAGSGMIAR